MTTSDAPINPAQLRKWKVSVDGSLEKLLAQLLPPREKCDELSAELGDLFTGVEGVQSDRDAIQIALLQAQEQKRAALDEMDILEAAAMMEVMSTLSESGKPKYTNDKTRAAAIKITLADNDTYQTHKKKLRESERSEATNRALLESFQDTQKTQRMQARALIARLNNLTAQMKG